MTENRIFNYDDNPAVVEDFDRLPRMFIPGYDASHAMAAVLLQLSKGDTGDIFAIGASASAELEASTVRDGLGRPIVMALIRRYPPETFGPIKP